MRANCVLDYSHDIRHLAYPIFQSYYTVVSVVYAVRIRSCVLIRRSLQYAPVHAHGLLITRVKRPGEQYIIYYIVVTDK